jgi:hypothetical protein
MSLLDLEHLQTAALQQPGAVRRHAGIKFQCPQCAAEGHDEHRDNACLFNDGLGLRLGDGQRTRPGPPTGHRPRPRRDERRSAAHDLATTSAATISTRREPVAGPQRGHDRRWAGFRHALRPIPRVSDGLLLLRVLDVLRRADREEGHARDRAPPGAPAVHGGDRRVGGHAQVDRPPHRRHLLSLPRPALGALRPVRRRQCRRARRRGEGTARADPPLRRVQVLRRQGQERAQRGAADGHYPLRTGRVRQPHQERARLGPRRLTQPGSRLHGRHLRHNVRPALLRSACSTACGLSAIGRCPESRSRR